MTSSCSFDAVRTTVIVADDDQDLRALVSETLRSDGYTVIEAGDGEELLSVLCNTLDDPVTCPDVILADVLMPKLSGLGVLEHLRRAQVRLPILMMTGFAPNLVAPVAKRLGAIGVIKKPFAVDDLRAALLNVRRRPRVPV